MTRARKLLAGILLFAVVCLSALTAAFATDNTVTYAYLPDRSVYFYDVEGNYAWAHREIDMLALNGVIQGGGNHLFSPGNQITRADFIVMLDRAYGMSDALESGAVAAQAAFSDVPENSYYSKAVNAARAFGVAVGTADNRFLPNQSMTRQDAMVFLKRLLDCTQVILPGGSLSSFADAGKVSSYAKDAVGALVTAGVVSGSNGKLNPQSLVTRAEMSVMLYRALHLEEQDFGSVYQARKDVVNVCIGSQIYTDVVIADYDPSKTYEDLMLYTDLWQEDGSIYIRLGEQKPIDQKGVYTKGMLTVIDAEKPSESESYPVSPSCVAIDVSGTYHQLESIVSTGSVYKGCVPTIEDGVVTVVYYA